jgi:hypothetical protein
VSWYRDCQGSKLERSMSTCTSAVRASAGPSARTGRPPKIADLPAQRPACVCGSKLPAATGSAAAPHHGVTGPLPSRSLAEEGRAMPAPARLARSCLRPGRPGGTSFPAVTPTTRIGERPRRARQSARPDDTPIEHVYDRGGPEARTRRQPALRLYTTRARRRSSSATCPRYIGRRR